MKQRTILTLMVLASTYLSLQAQVYCERWIDNNRSTLVRGNLVLGEQTFSMDASNMPWPGLHFLNVVPYEASGEMGVWRCIPFLMPEAWPNTTSATTMEYWVTGYDKQPKRQAYIGSAMTLNFDVANYAPGLHFLNLRTLNAAGEAGAWKVIPFLMTETWPNTTNATTMEYWVTGYDKHYMQLEYASSALVLDIDAASFSPGLHFLNLRTLNAAGEAGAWKVIPFLMPEAWPANSEATIMEYWVTGYDKTPKQVEYTSSAVTFDIDISQMSYGLHFLNIRTINELGEGGAWKQIPFYINNGIFDDELISYEYWIDEQDKIMATAVCPGVLQLEIDMENLSVGRHTLYFRANNWSGIYGETYTYEFEVTDNWDAISSVSEEEEPFDVFTVDGKMVRHQVTSLKGLPKGIYIFNGKKQIVR